MRGLGVYRDWSVKILSSFCCWHFSLRTEQAAHGLDDSLIQRTGLDVCMLTSEGPGKHPCLSACILASWCLALQIKGSCPFIYIFCQWQWKCHRWKILLLSNLCQCLVKHSLQTEPCDDYLFLHYVCFDFTAWNVILSFLKPIIKN